MMMRIMHIPPSRIEMRRYFCEGPAKWHNGQALNMLAGCLHSPYAAGLPGCDRMASGQIHGMPLDGEGYLLCVQSKVLMKNKD